MADDDGSRRPPQAYTTVSPVGVGTTTTNRVSPETIQEILNTGDQSQIDQAWEKLTVEDMIRYLESLPSPPDVGGAVSPTGVGTSARCRPLLQEREHLIVGVPFFLQEHALHTGVAPDCPLEDREEPIPHVDVNHRPPCLGHDLVLLNKSNLKGHLER